MNVVSGLPRFAGKVRFQITESNEAGKVKRQDATSINLEVLQGNNQVKYEQKPRWFENKVGISGNKEEMVLDFGDDNQARAFIETRLLSRGYFEGTAYSVDA